jgi:hypothetical protein
MKQLGKLLLIALGFGVLVAALSTFPSHLASASGGAPVIVTNTPLPVQGTVNAAQSGTWNVNAAQSGAWNVGITGNTSANPVFVRDADNPAKQPFVSDCSIGSLPGQCNFAAIPAGKELVIEMFTAVITMSSGDRPYEAVLKGVANGTFHNLFYPLSFNGAETGLGDLWVVEQPLTRTYFDPGTAPICFVGANSGQAIGADCLISGYLVNVP